MDFLNQVTSQVTGKKEEQKPAAPAEQSGAGGLLGKLGDFANSAAGGGKEAEKKEDLLDKGMFSLASRGYHPFLVKSEHQY